MGQEILESSGLLCDNFGTNEFSSWIWLERPDVVFGMLPLIRNDRGSMSRL